MKKVIAVVLAIVMVFSLAACGGDERDGQDRDKTIKINEENFEKYFLVSWHWENPTYDEPDGSFLSSVYGIQKAEFHVDVSPKSELEAEDVVVEFEIYIDSQYWGNHTKTESLTLRYDGEGSFWVPVSDKSYSDYTSYLPTKKDVSVSVVSASGKIVK